MFTPHVTNTSFDRNIFDGQGEEVTLKALNPVSMLFYFLGNIVVGTIEGTLNVLVYRGYSRGNYLPVEVQVDNQSYCGWVHINEIELLPI